MAIVVILGLLIVTCSGPGSDSESVQNQPPPKKWTAHPYHVVEVDNTSPTVLIDGRTRRTIWIVASTAISSGDRIATLVDAITDSFKSDHAHFIAGFLLPYAAKKDDGAIAIANYAHDGCGLTGKDCTGDFWTNINALNGTVFTREHEEFYKAWRKHRDGYLGEDELKDFLAELFDKDRAYIDKLSWEVWGSYPTEIELPSYLRGRIRY